MGNCASSVILDCDASNCAPCCSNDSTSEKKAKQLYMNSKKSRPEAKCVSQLITTKTDHDSDDEGMEISCTNLDHKTMKLLSPAFGPLDQVGLPPNTSQSTSIESTLSTGSSLLPNTVIPIISSSSTNLDELENRVTPYRVIKLSAIIDAEELEQRIKEQYTYAHTDDDDDESSLSEHEKSEILQRKKSDKNQSLSSDKNPSLYRPKSSSSWNEKRIQTETSDMEKQLLTLQNRASQTETNRNKNYKIVVDDIGNSNSPIDLDDLDDWDVAGPVTPVPEPLFRNKSADKWDTEAMITTKEEMQKEMISLMLNHQENVKT